MQLQFKSTHQSTSEKINITFYILPCLLLCNYLLVISVVGRLENRDQICLLVEMKCPFKVGSTTFLKDPTAPEMHFSDILLKKNLPTQYLLNERHMKEPHPNDFDQIPKKGSSIHKRSVKVADYVPFPNSGFVFDEKFQRNT